MSKKSAVREPAKPEWDERWRNDLWITWEYMFPEEESWNLSDLEEFQVDNLLVSAARVAPFGRQLTLFRVEKADKVGLYSRTTFYPKRKTTIFNSFYLNWSGRVTSQDLNGRIQTLITDLLRAYHFDIYKKNVLFDARWLLPCARAVRERLGRRAGVLQDTSNQRNMRPRILPVLTLGLLASPISGISNTHSDNQRPLVLPAPLLTNSESALDRYDGEQVWRVNWADVEDREKREFMSRLDSLNLDIWQTTSSTLDLRLPSSHLDHLHSLLSPSASAQIHISNLQHLIDVTRPDPAKPEKDWNLDSLNSTFHSGYHKLAELETFGMKLMERFEFVDRIEIGKSWEGRSIWGYRVRKDTADSKNSDEGGGGSDTDSSGGRRKKGGSRRGRDVRGEKQEEEEEEDKVEIVIQSGQHAREWIGPSVALYFLHSLAIGSEDPDSVVSQLLESFTFTVVPTINPDGYAWSHEKSRMWKKNRQDVGGKKNCKGIDLNSNWGYHWRPPHSPNPCSETFPGNHAFEAPEPAAMARYISNGSSDGLSGGEAVRSFVDLHSYGQLFMFPFAYSCSTFPPDAEMLMEAALGVSKAMRTTSGEKYQAGQACSMTFRYVSFCIFISFTSSSFIVTLLICVVIIVKIVPWGSYYRKCLSNPSIDLSLSMKWDFDFKQ
ncbi:hypothetical protein M231_07427 [Tremella mesenterica]|uniref:Inactive metallocarboxypeptidase ECM14 n=1 Tax=Tremella mesenterica TaxID=5217 RepID=A0A4Q1BCA6_TREME|nr:hypothetical protein M231_07427 [Tremella mesenterica]